MAAPVATPAARHAARRFGAESAPHLRFLSIILLVIGLLPWSRAAAEPAAITARALGMGNAYTAAAEGFHALYWNPAGLAVPANEISVGLGGLGWARLRDVLEQFEAGAPQTHEATIETFAGIRIGQVALGAAFQAETQPGGPQPANVRGLDWWAIGGGQAVEPPVGWRRLAVGLTLRRLTEREYVTVSQTLVEGRQGEVLDLGVLAEPTPELRIGAVLRRVWSSLERPEELDPAESRIGLAYHPEGWPVALRADLSTEGTLSYGGEWAANKQGSVVLRAGQQLDPGRTIMTTVGAGFHVGAVQIDLAAGLTQLDLASARVRAELSIRF
ncbi:MULTISPECIES: hypothetical protein [Limnochorda]|uniref:hypothetical protein n=1 Tax=Limnochorda TaxID=1676651 RepID=UPI0026ED40F3|nr:hypothetical protein [Limnochorda pilosa]